MKNFLQAVVSVGAFCMSALNVYSADCAVGLAVLDAPQAEVIPQRVLDYMSVRLQEIVSDDGVVADPGMTQFFIAGRFTHISEDRLPGPPEQTVVQTNLTLYIGDTDSKTVYSTLNLDLNGVGASYQKALTNAVRSLNSRNVQIKDFISRGRQKVIDYYDGCYRQIIMQAEAASAGRDHEKALYLLSQIPECSIGYEEASGLISSEYQKYIDKEGAALLQAANAEWSSSPDRVGAVRASGYLQEIDPESAAYTDAVALAGEIKATVKSDIDFELRQKYSDAVALERERISAARDIGVAYGRGQQPSTANLMWLK